MVNLTSHAVTFQGAIGSRRTIEPSGQVARVVYDETRSPRDFLLAPDLPRLVLRRVGVEGLPEPRPDVFLIVSRVVAEALPERRDLVFPHDFVRDETGRIVGAKAIAQIVAPA